MLHSLPYPNASRCALLMPAGSGTLAASRALGHYHTHHLIPRAPCYLLLLRPPDERLESGVRYELLDPLHGRRRLTRGFDNVSALVHALRARQPRALHLWRLSQSKDNPGSDGSFFLTPITFYLHRVVPAPVVALCHSRLTADLAALGVHASSKEHQRRAHAPASVLARSTLAPEERAWMRTWAARDVALVRAWCAPSIS